MKNINHIWDNFAEELKWFIRKQIKDSFDADDILQEVFIKIHRNIDSLNDETKIRAWIYQITRNTIIDFSRQRKIISGEFPHVDFFEEYKEDNPADRLAASIKKMIDELPPKYAEPLCLNECYGLAQKEVAEKIGLSISGTKSRIQRGRQLLRDELMKCCHYEFDKYGTLIDYHPIECRKCKSAKK